MADLPGAVVVGALWVLREVAGLTVQQLAARAGRIGYIVEEAQVVERIVDSKGNVLEAFFVRSHPQSQGDFVFANYSGHLYNDSATPLVLREPRIAHWGLSGPVINYPNPDCFVNGTKSVVVTVPAHGTTAIRLSVPMNRKKLDSEYLGTVPILSFATVQDRVIEFPLRRSAPYGGPEVAWDAKKRRVVAAGTKEWIRARIRKSLGSPVGRTRSSRP